MDWKFISRGRWEGGGPPLKIHLQGVGGGWPAPINGFLRVVLVSAPENKYFYQRELAMGALTAPKNAFLHAAKNAFRSSV